MKKKMLALSLVVILLTLVVGGTLAYFTDSDQAENVFTVGNVKIELNENNWVEENALLVYPGESVAKDPTVANTGNNPCYVRVKVENLDQFTAENKGAITLSYEGNAGRNTADWDLHNGYYYYLAELAVGEETTPVFDAIVFPTDLDGSESEPKPIVVKAQAVQSEGFSGAVSATALEAWFTTCGME